MSLLTAGLAGAIGAAARYLVSGWVQDRSRLSLPVGTFAVNTLGAFGLGLVLGLGGSGLALAAAAFFGGFTTFSTWMLETIRLGTWPRAMLNLLASGSAGVLAVTAGYMLTG